MAIWDLEIKQLDLSEPDSVWQRVSDVWQLAPESSMRILALTPMHPSYGIRPQSWDSIRAAVDAYQGHIDWFITKGDNPHTQPNDNIVRQHNKARRIALKGGYDALLSIEADMIVPPDAIAKLIACESDIAYGLYVWRNKTKRWSAYKTLSLWGGESVSLNHDGSDAREAWGQIIDVAGIGMGCTLIKWDVLEKIRFRLHDGEHDWITEEYAADFRQMGIDPYRERKNIVCDDWLLAMDAQHYGFTQRANLGLVCGHIDGDEIIWPDPTVDKLYRIEDLRS